MRRNVLLAACLVVALGTTACQDREPQNDMTSPTVGTAELQQSDFTRDPSLLKLPASVRVSDLRDPSRAVVPTACDDDTPVFNYFLERAFQIPLPTLTLLINRWTDLVPTYEALIFQTVATPQYFGYNGEYTRRMAKTEKDVKQFWDIESDDIQVLAMHGTVLADPAAPSPPTRPPSSSVCPRQRPRPGHRKSGP